ncbi:protein eyes shut-like isoform X3 [Vespa velutina]|uniref:protein eyes shut-like isoform X3 n=1 Tax=Vespa velutina TaxID=202808 RepID=UPI001FB4388B|nr:protein eyes shut-like isoform X3 [Vespa velutina]
MSNKYTFSIEFTFVPRAPQKVFIFEHFFLSSIHLIIDMGRWVHVGKKSNDFYGIVIVLATVCMTTLVTGESLIQSNCSIDPCMYGICLDNDNSSSYSCYCIDGYTGINCEINWDDCWSNPCLNGGVCTDAVAAYNCTCSEGFIGINCEQKYSECANQPCLNNGTCLDYDGFICQCPDGYSGDYCEIDASVCNDTICKNYGECIEGPGFSFFCRCPAGWTGRLCDEDIDECVTSPCKNGGLCINVPATYTCACLFGFTGKDCDKVILPCDQNLCQNGAVCLLEDNKSVCYCVPDYHGTLCELKYDDCESKSANCENGGTCIDGINSYTCACPPDYSGMICEEYIISSTSTPFMTKGSIEVNVSSVKSIDTSSSESTPTSMLFTSTSSSLYPYPITSMLSTTVSKTIDHYTKWYPSIETTSAMETDRNVVTTSTENVSFFTETSLIFVQMSTKKDASETHTVSEARITEEETIPTTSEISVPITEPISYHNFTDGTRASDIDQDNITESFSSISVSSTHQQTSKEINSTPSYTTSTTGYYPTVEVTDFKDVKNDTTTRSSRLFTDATTASSILDNDNFLVNTTLIETIFTTEPPTVSTISEEELSSTLTSTSVITPKSSTTQSREHSTTISAIVNGTETTVNLDLENSTLHTKYDQVSIATEQSSTSIECNENSCVTGTNMPSARNVSDCNCTEHEEECKSIKSAAFNGKSYARQSINININNDTMNLRIYVKLRTRFKNGIIFHVYFDDERYALIYLESSILKFQFSCGLETMLLGEIDSAINNGFEAEIDMRFEYYIMNKTDKCSARLLVNGTTAVSGEQMLSLREKFPHRATLNLGGIPLAFSHYFPRVAMGFIGCMNSLMVNGIQKNFIHDSTETFQIEECTSFFCLSNPCQNFGACEETNGVVRCHCVAGYTGTLCERSICDENPCSLGATCISSPGTGFICICPIGTHGLFCEEDTIVIRPSFSSLVPGFSSYIAYGVSNSIKDTMELKMKLIPHTLDQISLIAYLGQSGSRQEISDHLSITYVRGYIMLTWDLGSGKSVLTINNGTGAYAPTSAIIIHLCSDIYLGVRRIFTKTPLASVSAAAAPGIKSHNPHTLHIGRKGRDAWLAIDGTDNVTGQAAGVMSQLDVSPILYIGGHKSKNFEMLPHDLPLHTGFSGCIFDIELRTKDTVFPVTSSSPATGRGVGECHRNECIRHSCKNGAVCLNHGSTYSCICTKDWTGPDCSVAVEKRFSSNLSTCHISNQ